MILPETRRANFYKLVTEHVRRHIGLLADKRVIHLESNIQLYLEVDVNNLKVTLKTRDRKIAVFHKAPSLAQAVIRARKFRKDYYPKNQVLEYIK